MNCMYPASAFTCILSILYPDLPIQVMNARLSGQLVFLLMLGFPLPSLFTFAEKINLLDLF